MLIIRKFEKTEAIIELLQAYYQQRSEEELLAQHGITLVHSQTSVDLFNLVFGMTEPLNVLDVAGILDQAKAYSTSFFWMTLDSHVNLGQYLVNQGLEKRGVIASGYYNISGGIPAFDQHPAVQLVEVDTEELFYEWCQVFATCQGMAFSEVEAYFRKDFEQEGQTQLFVAEVYQKSIGASMLFTHEKKSLLLWNVVLPVYRRQGVGSMMVLNQMALAKQAGVEAIYAFGLYAQYDMLKSLGFKFFSKFDLYRYEYEGLNG